MAPPTAEFDVILDAAAIAALVARLAREIAPAFDGRPVVALPVMTGACFFAPDLLRALVARGTDVEAIRPVSVSSYGAGTTSSGAPEVVGLPPRPAIEGRHLLVIDTIVDTGATVEVLGRELAALGAASVRVACLLDKVAGRTRSVVPTWRGIVAPDRFLVGYGLDAAGRYRALPFVGAIRGRDRDPTFAPAAPASSDGGPRAK
jgi:hypoxanthine phosphoribosyltransferase